MQGAKNTLLDALREIAVDLQTEDFLRTTGMRERRYISMQRLQNGILLRSRLSEEVGYPFSPQGEL